VPTLKRSFGRYGATYFGFYVGSNDPYPGFLDDNKLFDRELREAKIKHLFRIYEGAHNNAFWAEHQDEWLAGAVERLDRPA
jgi:enterochelin esterase-like enzyme